MNPLRPSVPSILPPGSSITTGTIRSAVQASTSKNPYSPSPKFLSRFGRTLLLLAAVLPVLLPVLLPASTHGQAVDVSNSVEYLGQSPGRAAGALRYHQGKIYIMNGQQSTNAQARYYDVATGQFGQNGTIETEAPYGLSIKYGDLLWYGEDLAGLGNTSALYRLKQNGWKYYIPPAANAHQQSQTLFDGKVFASTWTRQFPGACISSDDGASWNNVNLQGQNGFATQLEGLNVKAAPIVRYFEFQGNLFGTSTITYLDQTYSNGTLRSTAKSENYMMRYTRDPAKPWELTLRRFNSLPFVGRPSGSDWAVTDNTKPGFTYYTEFKGYLFLDWYGVVNRYGHKTVPSLSNPAETYDRPDGTPVVVSNFLADSSGNLKAESTSALSYLTPRNGYLYRIQYDVEIDQMSFWRTSDATNWEKVCYFNTGTGSPLSSLDLKILMFELVGSDIYFCTPDRKLYKIPASALGSLALDGTQNTAPVANNDTYACDRGLVIDDSMQGLLLNDTDADNDAIYTSLETAPANGTVELAYNGTFTYVPYANFVGTDTFTYRISDGFDSAVGTVSITTQANAAPTSLSLSRTSVNEQLPVDTVVGTLSTVDPDTGDSATYSLVGGDVAAFQIVGNELRTSAVFDTTVKDSYALTIRSTDGSGAFVDRAYTIAIDSVFGLVDGKLILDRPSASYKYDAKLGVRDANATYTGAPIVKTSGRTKSGINQDYLMPSGGYSTPLPFTVRYDFAAAAGRKFTTASVLSNIWQYQDAASQSVVLKYSYDGIHYTPLFNEAGSRFTSDPLPDIAGKTSVSLIWEYSAGAGNHEIFLLFASGPNDPGMVFTATTDLLTPYETISTGFDWGSTPVEQRTPTADANNNGISNLLEFAFNLSPTAPGGPTTLTPGTGTSGLPAFSVINPAAPTLQIEYLRRKNSGLTYTVRFSDDLITWDDAVATPTPTSINAEWERMVMPDTAGAGHTKRFGKVVVSEAP